MKIIVCKAGRQTERYFKEGVRYFVDNPEAEPYLTFLRKIARGVSIADAAEQTIGPIADFSITFGDPDSGYHYMLRVEAGAVAQEQLISRPARTTEGHIPHTIFYRKGEHTTIARAAARDLPTSYSAVPETAFYTEESREFRLFLFDIVWASLKD